MKLVKLNTLNFITDLGGSLQKDLNVATQALEDVALESANVAKEVSKEVLNPLAKFTKVRKKISAPFRYRVIKSYKQNAQIGLNYISVFVLKGIQHFGGHVLNSNKTKMKDGEVSDVNNQAPSEVCHNQQPISAHSKDLQPSPNVSRSASSNTIQQDYMATKISDSSSTTKVLLL